jgi:hypothetical protein
MMPPIDPRSLEMDDLLSELLDGPISEEGFARLQALLASSPELRDYYVEYLSQCHDLQEVAALAVGSDDRTMGSPPPPAVAAGMAGASGGGDVPASKAGPAAVAPARKGASPEGRSWGGRSRGSRLARYAAACALGLGVGALAMSRGWSGPRPPAPPKTADVRPVADRPPVEYVATLISSAGAVWEDPVGPVGSRLVPGMLRLRGGVAEVLFDGGSSVVIEGPARLRVESRSEAHLLAGKAVFLGDASAEPFRLVTPTSVLTDVGTEYAVAVDPGAEEVHVFSGQVRREALRASEASALLDAGQARRYPVGPPTAAEPVPLARDRFVREVAIPDPVHPDDALLAYDPFAYDDRDGLRAGTADGGVGWTIPWRGSAGRYEGPSDGPDVDTQAGLTFADGREVGPGRSLLAEGVWSMHRRLRTPLRLDEDGVYYLSYLVRLDGLWDERNKGFKLALKPEGPSVRDRKVLFGVDIWRGTLLTELVGEWVRAPLPLEDGRTYLIVGKIVAGRDKPDQVMTRLFRAGEPLGPREPDSWSVVSPPAHLDDVLELVTMHCTTWHQQRLGELRIGTTWASVTFPWWQGSPR